MLEDDRTMADDPDRTMMLGGAGSAVPLADDDRTMLAPPAGGRPSAPLPGGRPPQPVMPPPRRRVVAEERSGIHPMVWVALVLVLAAGGFFAFQQMGGRSGTGPVAADSLPVDTAKQDTIDNVDALALSMEGLRLLRGGDPALALDFFRRAHAMDERNPEYRDQMAVALIRLGRYSEAAELLEETIRIDRRYDLAYSHLAEARLAMGDTVSTMQALTAFLEISQDAGDRQRALTLLQQLRSATQPPPLQPVPGPRDTTPSIPQPQPPQDTIQIGRPAPRDTIRFPR